MNAIYHDFFTILQLHKLWMGLTNIVDTNTNDSSLSPQTQLSSTQSTFSTSWHTFSYYYCNKVCNKVKYTKHREFLLSFQSISWSSFYPHSWNSMSCFTGQYNNNTMSLSILCHSERAVQAGPASCNHWYLVKHFIFKYFLFCLPRWQQKITASLQY